MKKSVAIGIAVGVVLLIGVFAIVFVPSREPLSLTFLHYTTGRDGAKLKLTNNSSKTISYLADHDGTPIFSYTKTSIGWTNTSLPLTSATSSNSVTGETNQIYLVFDLDKFRWGGPFPILYPHTLEPGESAELFVWLQADGPPMRVGTVCILPQGKLAQQFGRWMDRVKRWCRMKPTVPGQVEVWCKEPLQVSTSPTHRTNHYDL